MSDDQRGVNIAPEHVDTVRDAIRAIEGTGLSLDSINHDGRLAFSRGGGDGDGDDGVRGDD